MRGWNTGASPSATPAKLLDLHKTVTDICAPQPPHIYSNCSICRMEPCSYHYKPAGYDLISKPIAAAVRRVLQ